MQQIKYILAAIQQGKTIHPAVLAKAQAELARVEAMLHSQAAKHITETPRAVVEAN